MIRGRHYKNWKYFRNLRPCDIECVGIRGRGRSGRLKAGRRSITVSGDLWEPRRRGSPDGWPPVKIVFSLYQCFRYWYWGHLGKLWFASCSSRRDVMLAVDLYVYITYANMTVNINKERRNCPVLVYLPQLFGKGGGSWRWSGNCIKQFITYSVCLSVCLSAVRSTAHRDRKTNQCTHHSTDPLDI